MQHGGDTPVVKTSALTGQGIPELLEMLGIVAELRCELKANPARPASGTCLEASISEGRGVVATVLVQDGTLYVGDVILSGPGHGRIWFEAERNGKFPKALFLFTRSEQNKPKIIVRLRVFGFEPDSLFVSFGGFGITI